MSNANVYSSNAGGGPVPPKDLNSNYRDLVENTYSPEQLFSIADSNSASVFQSRIVTWGAPLPVRPTSQVMSDIDPGAAWSQYRSKDLEIGAKLVKIRSILSLSVAELSRVLLVERQTIYSWLRGDSLPRPGNVERIDQILSVALQWQRAGLPAEKGILRREISNGKTFIVLLSEKYLRSSVLERSIEGLKVRDEPKRRGQRGRSSATKLGLGQTRDGQSHIDALTGVPPSLIDDE